MAKPISLEPTQIDSGLWRLNVPEKVSPTGKRQRLLFDTKKQAELEAERIRGMSRKWGTEGRKVTASTADDASKASELLKGYDISLTALAKRYIDEMTKLSESKSFADVWTQFEESRELKSDDHKRTLARIGRKLKDRIGKQLVCTITHQKLRTALKKDFTSAHSFNLAVRSVSPAFNMAIREGWCSENPCQRIEKVDTGRKAPIAVLTLNQCRKLLSACKDYRKDKKLHENYKVDARGALPAVAIMLFSGVRPIETTRLNWEDIDIEEGTILVSNQKAKTDRSRFFKMPDTLKAWLELTPKHERLGSVCPANWKRIIQAVRKKSAIGTEGRDQLRKTFATMHLAHFNDVNLTRSIMGHEQGDVLFTNYRGLVKPKSAAEFWDIYPKSNNSKLEAVG